MADTFPAAAPEGSRQTFTLVDAHTKTENLKGEGGCGCGGHGHGGGGCGGHGHGHAHGAPTAEGEATGGCGCGGHGHAHSHSHAEDIAATRVEELEIHAIPKVVRHAVLFAAVDSLPVGENLQILAPHRPEPLFAHLEESESHYRVETVEPGPKDWRYRITRIS